MILTSGEDDHKLARIAPTVYLANNDHGDRPGLELFRDNVCLVGEVFGMPERVEEVLADLQSRVAEVAARVPAGTTVSHITLEEQPGQIASTGRCPAAGGSPLLTVWMGEWPS